MATTKAQQKAVHKYVREKYDRIGLTVPKGQKAKIEAAASLVGESVNLYAQKAILSRMGLEDWPELSEEESEE